MALSTVSGILTRIGLGRLGRLGLEPPQRYERERPCELIHIDIKKLGRIQRGAGHRITGIADRKPPAPTDAPASSQTVGWEYVHIAIDDYTPPGLRRGPPRRDSAHRHRFPPTRRRVLRPPRHHGRAADHRQRSRLPLHGPCDRLPRPRVSATSAPAPTGLRPTAKPNASSAPSSPAGPTARSTAPAPNAPQPLTDGSGTTTITANTQPSATNRPSLAFASGTNLDGTYT